MIRYDYLISLILHKLTVISYNVTNSKHATPPARQECVYVLLVKVTGELLIVIMMAMGMTRKKV